jgi:hypothetical protein
MKLFIFLLLFVNLSFAQLKTQELDGIVIVPEKNPALIEKKETNEIATSLSRREMKQLIEDIYIKPMPSEPTGGVGWIYNANGDGEITFCPKAPEPNTSVLIIIGLGSLLLFRRRSV